MPLTIRCRQEKKVSELCRVAEEADGFHNWPSGWESLCFEGSVARAAAAGTQCYMCVFCRLIWLPAVDGGGDCLLNERQTSDGGATAHCDFTIRTGDCSPPH